MAFKIIPPVYTRSGTTDVDRFTREIGEKVVEINTALNSISTSAANILVLDEGALVTPVVTILNFVGSGVAATGVGNIVTVTVPGAPPPTITVASQGVTQSTAVTTVNVAGYGIGATGGTTATITVNGDIIVQAAITTNVALSGIPSTTVADQVTLVANDLVLLTAQTTASENGVYALAAGAWSRQRLVAGNNACGCRIYVSRGQYWGTVRYECTSLVGADVVGTNNLAWQTTGLLPDLGFDSFDTWAYAYNEDPTVGYSAVDTTYGTSRPLTMHSGGSPLSLGSDVCAYNAPFRGAAFLTLANGQIGYYGANNGLTLPSTGNWTMGIWVKPLFSSSSAGASATCVLGRTNTNTPTWPGYPTEYDFVLTFPASVLAGASDTAYRYPTTAVRLSGGAPVTGGTTTLNNSHLIWNVGEWTYYQIERDTSRSTTNLYVTTDGKSEYTIAVATISTTSTGYWFIAQPNYNLGGSGLAAASMLWARWRLSVGVTRGAPWAKEIARRGKSYGT